MCWVLLSRQTFFLHSFQRKQISCFYALFVAPLSVSRHGSLSAGRKDEQLKLGEKREIFHIILCGKNFFPLQVEID